MSDQEPSNKIEEPNMRQIAIATTSCEDYEYQASLVGVDVNPRYQLIIARTKKGSCTAELLICEIFRSIEQKIMRLNELDLIDIFIDIGNILEPLYRKVDKYEGKDVIKYLTALVEVVYWQSGLESVKEKIDAMGSLYAIEKPLSGKVAGKLTYDYVRELDDETRSKVFHALKGKAISIIEAPRVIVNSLIEQVQEIDKKDKKEAAQTVVSEDGSKAMVEPPQKSKPVSNPDHITSLDKQKAKNPVNSIQGVFRTETRLLKKNDLEKDYHFLELYINGSPKPSTKIEFSRGWGLSAMKDWWVQKPASNTPFGVDENPKPEPTKKKLIRAIESAGFKLSRNQESKIFKKVKYQQKITTLIEPKT